MPAYISTVAYMDLLELLAGAVKVTDKAVHVDALKLTFRRAWRGNSYVVVNGVRVVVVDGGVTNIVAVPDIGNTEIFVDLFHVTWSDLEWVGVAGLQSMNHLNLAIMQIKRLLSVWRMDRVSSDTEIFRRGVAYFIGMLHLYTFLKSLRQIQLEIASVGLLADIDGSSDGEDDDDTEDGDDDDDDDED
jgi:hypothetical protein